MPIVQPAVALSTRQEAFCRHFVASGNAADAARRAGYSERSAWQTGCDLLERPYIVERLRRIRLSWKRTERDGGDPRDDDRINDDRADGFDDGESDGTDWPEHRDFVPEHDRS